MVKKVVVCHRSRSVDSFDGASRAREVEMEEGKKARRKRSESKSIVFPGWSEGSLILPTRVRCTASLPDISDT